MTHFDLSPLYRSSIGFDRLASLMDAANRTHQGQPTYPPYNIEQVDEDNYAITMAVAGFTSDDLEIESKSNLLTIKGNQKDTVESRQYLHQGIAKRSFEHRFQLADFVKVSGANLENGLLHVDLLRELPEAMKPRIINIDTKPSETVFENSRVKAA